MKSICGCCGRPIGKCRKGCKEYRRMVMAMCNNDMLAIFRAGELGLLPPPPWYKKKKRA